MTSIRIKLASNTLHGAGAATELASELLALQVRSVGVIVDEAVAELSSVGELLRGWGAAGLACGPVFRSRTGSEPDYDYLDAVAGDFRRAAPQAVAAIGGGSTMDLGKGVAILLRNGGTGLDYRGVDLVPEAGVPIACVPTTAGSGSEATATASFIDRGTGRKLGINGRHVAASVAALDPLLLVGCPHSVAVGSGLDALVHAVEAVTARTATPVSVALGCEAARLLFAALPVVAHRSDDLAAWSDALLGAHLAGLAMQNAAGGPASGVSYPLGVHWGVPHGYAGGILLPHVVAANAAVAEIPGQAVLAAAVGADDFVGALHDLYRRIGAPLDLRGWNVGPDDVERLVELTLAERQENLELNPVPFGRDELRELLVRVTSEEG